MNTAVRADRLDPRTVPTSTPRGGQALAPWTSEELLRFVGGNALGVILIVIGVFQVVEAFTVSDQLAWLNLGLAGLGVCGATNAIWMFHGRARLGRARIALLGDIVPALATFTTLEQPPLVTIPGTTRFHSEGCPFTEGREAVAETEGQFRINGLEPCEICLPTQGVEVTA